MFYDSFPGSIQFGIGWYQGFPDCDSLFRAHPEGDVWLRLCLRKGPRYQKRSQVQGLGPIRCPRFRTKVLDVGTRSQKKFLHSLNLVNQQSIQRYKLCLMKSLLILQKTCVEHQTDGNDPKIEESNHETTSEVCKNMYSDGGDIHNEVTFLPVTVDGLCKQLRKLQEYARRKT